MIVCANPVGQCSPNWWRTCQSDEPASKDESLAEMQRYSSLKSSSRGIIDSPHRLEQPACSVWAASHCTCGRMRSSHTLAHTHTHTRACMHTPKQAREYFGPKRDCRLTKLLWLCRGCAHFMQVLCCSPALTSLINNAGADHDH